MNAKETGMAKHNLQQQHRKMVAAEIEKVQAAAKILGKENLRDWDKRSLELAADIAKQNRLSDLESSLRELFKLSGMDYAVERSVYYSRRAAQRQLKDKTDG